MQHGIILTAGTAPEQLELAEAAEAAGWDGVFTWDAIAIGDADVLDPWVLLGGIAARTGRVRLGAIVFAPSRRRPWKLLKEAVTIDHLSSGRLVLPVGLGALDDAGFGTVGEATGARVRAERLDETLAIIDGLQAGRPFAYQGRHYRFDEMTLRPRPVQRPRIPVWVVGAWPHERSMRRAAAWDGLVVQGPDEQGLASSNPPQLASIVSWVRETRAAAGLEGPFDVVVSGTTPAHDRHAAASVTATASARGATWWVEADWGSPSVADLRRRIEAGPPRP